MLPSSQRLSRNEIDYLYKKGVKKVTPGFIAKYLPGRKTKSRFCVVVSIKIAPKAVARNRVRRQLYEAIRLNQHLLGKNYDIMFILKSTFIKLEFQEISSGISQFFKNL